MKILILEDEKYFQNEIIKYINNFNKSYTYSIFSNISDCQKNTETYQLGIIDIKLDDGDGIEYIKKHHDKFENILFLSSMENRVFDAFGKNVVGFIPKDKIEQELPNKLEEISKTLFNKKAIHVKTQDGFINLDLNSIIYLETQSKNINIIADKQYILKRISLSQFSKNLDDKFVWISQSIIINLDYVTAWKKDKILLNNTYTVYASRRHLKKSFLKFTLRR